MVSGFSSFRFSATALRFWTSAELGAPALVLGIAKEPGTAPSLLGGIARRSLARFASLGFLLGFEILTGLLVDRLH